MSYVETSALKNSTIMLLYSEKDEICINPSYQRMGGVWTIEKKRLLIDSILNDYDIPKIYFHLYDNEMVSKSGQRYAVIDGRQRLEAIWQFMDGSFTLAHEFEYQRDPAIDLSGLSYQDIAKRYPKIRIKFDSFVLPIVTVSIEGDEIDLIEDMFSRLNEAVPLNAAEKRNAFGGDLVQAITQVSEHSFFTNCVRFRNNRYQHREAAARFLLIEDSLNELGRLVDTKKEYLDNLAIKYHSNERKAVRKLRDLVTPILDAMHEEFTFRDELLLAQGSLVVYYLVFRAALESGQLDLVNRKALLEFRERLAANRVLAETNLTDSSFELLEFDRLSQQGTNDASGIRERFSILTRALGLEQTEVQSALT